MCYLLKGTYFVPSTAIIETITIFDREHDRLISYYQWVFFAFEFLEYLLYLFVCVKNSTMKYEGTILLDHHVSLLQTSIHNVEYTL